MADDTTKAIYQAIWDTDYDTDLAANGRCGSHRLAEQITGALAKNGLLATAPPNDAIEEAAAILAERDPVVSWTALPDGAQEGYRQDARALAAAGLLAAPAARLPKGAASQIATTVHNALCSCMDNHTGITLRSSERDLAVWLHAEAVWNWRHLADRYDRALEREHALRASAVVLPESWMGNLWNTLATHVDDLDNLNDANEAIKHLIESWRPATVAYLAHLADHLIAADAIAGTP